MAEKNWTPHSEAITDILRPEQADGLVATLDLENRQMTAGRPLPPCWHWCYFASRTPAHRLSPDGHEQLGEFLPPVPLPRRMWAGSRITFHKHLTLGAQAKRTSRASEAIYKKGRSGDLAFITVGHDLTDDQGGHIEEEHDIVYREAPRQDAPAPTPVAPSRTAQWQEVIKPDPVMLFRYSALTFNGHRIHYDRDFCRDEEGYPGLVFHGPLTASLLLEGLYHAHPDLIVRRYEFRAIAPLFDIAPFTIAGCLEGKQTHLWAVTPEGGLAMEAVAEVD